MVFEPLHPIFLDRGGGIDHVLLEQAFLTEDGVEVVEAGEEAVGVVVAQREAGGCGPGWSSSA